MGCCSGTCEKRLECGKHYINIAEECYVEDYSNFGSGTFTDDGYKVDYWCGKLGDYKMFQPIKLTKEEFITLHCNLCGSQRCEGIGTEWFDGCKFKNHLSE